MGRLLGGAVLAALASATLASPAIGQLSTPFDVPVPTQPAPTDVLSTTAADGDGTGTLPGADLCRTAPRPEIRIPADDAAHPRAYLEWWWWYGEVETKKGHRLGYLLFWQGRSWADAQLVHYAVTDLTAGTFHFGHDRVDGAPTERRDGFALAAAHAQATGGDGSDRIRLEVDGYRLDLSLETVKPPAVLGNFSSFCNDLNMYSRVRMPTRGTLTRDGRQQEVRGTSHFDRAWGFNPAFVITNVTAITFELDDGRDLLAADIRFREGGDEYSYRMGYVSDRHGEVRRLHRPDFTMDATGYWRRDASCRYPTRWVVEIDGERLVAEAAVPSAEIRVTDPLTIATWPEWPTIWDGPTRVSGTASGHGWLDLTHYCYA